MEKSLCYYLINNVDSQLEFILIKLQSAPLNQPDLDFYFNPDQIVVTHRYQPPKYAL